MKCPHCGSDRVEVGDSRGTLDGAVIVRRRYCQACPERFTTYEFTVYDLPDECFNPNGLILVPREAATVALEREVAQAVRDVIRRLNSETK